MNNAELLQQLAALNWVIREGPPTSDSSASSSSSTTAPGEERARQIYALITGARVVDEVYQRITKKREIDQAWGAVILRVADYVKTHPRASEKEQVDFVRAELKSFEDFVNAL